MSANSVYINVWPGTHSKCIISHIIENFTSTINILKLLGFPVFLNMYNMYPNIFAGMKEHVYTLNVLKLLHMKVIFKGIEKHILARNTMSVINGVKPIVNKVLLKCIKDQILARNTMFVISVLKCFLNKVLCKGIKKHILERNPMDVISVVKPFQGTVIFKGMKESHTEFNMKVVFSILSILSSCIYAL